MDTNGTAYTNLWERDLIWQAVAIAVKVGITLSYLESILPQRRLIMVDGTPTGEAFLAAAEAKKSSAMYSTADGTSSTTTRFCTLRARHAPSATDGASEVYHSSIKSPPSFRRI